jgi:hypothetical protein
MSDLTIRRSIVSLAVQHKDTWRDKPESYWFARLVQEVGELGSSLVGDHDDPAEWELKQIATICENWLRLREQQSKTDKENLIAECLDCGMPYRDFPLDTTLPDDQWLMIHPEGENGLLCASCMVRRASRLTGIIAVRARFDFGEDLLPDGWTPIGPGMTSSKPD